MYEKDESLLLTVREVARRCGRSEETVRRWIWSGKLPARKLGNQLFVEAAELARLQLGTRVAESAVAYRPAFSRRGRGRAGALRTNRGPYNEEQRPREDKEDIVVITGDRQRYTKEELMRQIDDDERFAVDMRAKYGDVDLTEIFRQLREEDD